PWREASPSLVEAILKRALSRPSGNWFVLAGSEEVRRDRPFGRMVAGTELVAWRTPDGIAHAGPGACPHMGAPLCRGAVAKGSLVCRWHGLALGPDGFPGWSPYPVHDDGGLGWGRPDHEGGEGPPDTPNRTARPGHATTTAA